MRIIQIFSFAYLSVLLFSCNDEVSNEVSPPLDGIQVPAGFTIERVVDPELISYPMFATFDDKGRMFVFESTGINDMGTDVMIAEPSYHIRLLEDMDGDGEYESSKIYADKIPFPMGGSFYDGSLYVAASPEYIKLTDEDGDGVADSKETLLEGWVLNQNGAILSGPFMGPDGWMYMADARRTYDITSQEGKHMTGQGARIWRCKPDGSELEWMSAGGFDNSIEVIFMPSGESIGTMTYFTDPKNGQRDALMHWVEGGVYPKPQAIIAEDGLPLTGELMPVMTKLPRVAPSGLMRYEGESWGPEFAGNLFSAEFNTGRIMRHKVSSDGASYKTEDEAFITSTQSDIHLTDVLQDGDGSMLVLVTGGWFINGCPLSQVAKPEVPGGIYRIRKADSPKSPKDIWGQKLDFEKASAEDLQKWLTDSRPQVRKNAMEALIKRGTSSLPVLQAELSSTDAEGRARIVFALYRIGGSEAMGMVREHLKDEELVVRVAAARCVGLAKDAAGLSLLTAMVIEDELPARRQAATALGQIGSQDAVASLMQASATAEDRVLEHTIIHSLMTLGSVSELKQGLASDEEMVQKASLIALDQMKPSALEESELFPFLTSENESNRSVGIWVASHRPEWSNVVEQFLNVGIDAEDLTDLRKLLLLFCGNEKIQKLMLNQLQKTNSEEQQLFILDVMKTCSVREFPSQWRQAMVKMLKTSTVAVKLEILDLLESRGLKQLEGQLTAMASNDGQAMELRLKALSARMMTDKSLSGQEFEYLKSLMTTDHASYTRQQAVRLVSRSELTKDQLVSLASVELAEAEPFLLTGLLDVFKGGKDESVGMAMVAGLKQSTERLENVSMQDMENLLESYPAGVATAAQPLLETITSMQADRLRKLQAIEASLIKGDVAEGRKLFFGKAICSTCHAVGEEGSTFGPDLSNIGEIRSAHDILEAIVYPSVSFAREYDTYKVKTSSDSYTGVIKEQTGEVLVLTMGPGHEVRIPQSEVVSIEEHNVSMMPAGLDQQLNEAEMSHLMAFLQALPYNLDRIIEINNAE